MKPFYIFLKHDFKSLLRSPLMGRNVISVFFSLLSILLLVVSFPFLGYLVEEIILATTPEGDVVQIVFTNTIHYYFALLLLLSYGMSVSLDNATTYLLFPKYRNKLVWFLITKAILNKYILAFVLFMIPFFVRNVIPDYGVVDVVFFVMGYLGLQLLVSLLVMLFKNLGLQSWKISLVSFFIFGLLFTLSKLQLLELNILGSLIFETFLGHNYLLLITIWLSIVLLFEKNFQLVSVNFYIDQHSKVTEEKSGWLGEHWFERFPIDWRFVFQLMGFNDIKRPALLLSIFFYVIFVVMLRFSADLGLEGFNLFMYYQMFGSSLIVNFMPMFFPMLSTYMDGMQARKFDVAKYQIIVYRLIVLIYFLLFFLSAPVIHFYTDKLYLIFSLTCFHAGFSSCAYIVNNYLFAGRTELGKRAASSGKLMMGTLVVMTGVVCSSYFTHKSLSVIFGDTVANAVIIFIGLVFIATHTIWIKEIAEHFQRNKYAKLQIYRTN